jgi:hypothetical protein
VHNLIDDPEILYCASYQDGLMHALQRVQNLRSTGEYSHLCDVQEKLRGYQHWRTEKLKVKKYEDVAYIDGYMNGLLFVALQKDGEGLLPPLYYLYARQPWEIEDFATFSKALRRLKRHKLHHKGAHAHALKSAKTMNPRQNKKLVVHHACQLF